GRPARRARTPWLPAGRAGEALPAAQGVDRPADARPLPTAMKVAVIGAGFAGLSAAVDLQERRHQVTLLERRGVLGGRATSYRDAISGEDVDNGTHVMIGAYADTLDLVRRAGAQDLLLEQDDLHIDSVDDRGYTSLHCPPLPP